MRASAPRDPASTQHARALFAFRSNRWYNLHHFLYERARIRHGLSDDSTPALAEVRNDTVGLGSLSSAERAGWDQAVAYYDTALVAHGLDFDSSAVIAANYALADRDADRTLVAAPGLPTALAAALTAAAPAYDRVWWPRHDRANRAWIASVSPLVRSHGSAIARQLQVAYRIPWPETPVRVEVVAYANWAGAYTTLHPTLVTIASRYRGTQSTSGLEILFHEPSHAMMDSVSAALRAVDADPRGPIGRVLEHAIIFFTAGELTRAVVPGYVPYAEQRGFWRPGGYLARWRVPLRAEWLPYLRAGGNLRAVLARVVATG
jgi:hypothetical protein